MDREREALKRLDQYRLNIAGAVQNSVLDDFFANRLGRREFIRQASVFGLSASAISLALIAAACGTGSGGGGTPTSGGRLKMGIIPPPAHDIEPHTFEDQGALETGSICGEFLIRSAPGLVLVPELATTWTPNADASAWTVKLRANVKFQHGPTMKADDVVTTFKRLVGAGSQAQSAFKNVLTADGISKVDDLTVMFQLQNPTASFPYLLSSTTYQAIILPADYQVGTFVSKPQVTGAFKLTSYTPGVGAKYDRFSGWWGGTAPLDGVDVTYYSDAAAADAALLGKTVDLLGQIQLSSDRSLFNNSAVQIFTARGATHRQIPMAVDLDVHLKDARVRQAIALTLDRPTIIKNLFNNFADIGNDSPWAPVYPSTVGAPNVPQRAQDINMAKSLMSQAGYANGFNIVLTTEQTGEIPQLAQIVQSSVKQIGINMSLNIMTSTAYFAGSYSGGKNGLGNTPWLNTPMNITDWGHRSVPNVYLTSALESGGVWNAAHYANPAFDAAAKSFIGAIALADQQKYAQQAETIMLADTPVIFPYFYNYLTAGSPSVKNYNADPLGTVFLSKTSLG